MFTQVSVPDKSLFQEKSVVKQSGLCCSEVLISAQVFLINIIRWGRLTGKGTWSN